MGPVSLLMVAALIATVAVWSIDSLADEPVVRDVSLDD